MYMYYAIPVILLTTNAYVFLSFQMFGGVAGQSRGRHSSGRPFLMGLTLATVVQTG